MAYREVPEGARDAVGVVMRTLDALPTADRLLALRSLAVLLGTRRAATVLAARADGLSWGDIADRLGMSRQSVWNRYRIEEAGMLAPGRGRPPRPRPKSHAFSNCAAYKAVTRRPPLL